MKKRDWKKYEKGLLEKKRKIAEFILSRPTVEEVVKELEKLNKGKRGRKYQVPKSVLLLFHFLKHVFRIDDRLLSVFLSSFLNTLIPRETPFDHSTIVKRREGLDFAIPFGITPERLNGKRLYFDGMCLRVGRGGYYRSKRYKTDVKYLKIGLFTDGSGKVVDFVIGDEHDSEIGMIKGKLPLIKKSMAEAMVIDGAGSAHEIVEPLVPCGIKPVIKASKTTVKSMDTKPPPESCIRKKEQGELIWQRYAKEQQDHEVWKKESGYTMRWVYSEGVISSFKRMFGEETVSRFQKTLHDEICAKFMLLDGNLPMLWY